MKYQDFKKYYEEARAQYDNHLNMVSGCWRISGRDLCDNCALDYDAARDYETEQDYNDYDMFYMEQRGRITRVINNLTAAQEQQLHAYCRENYYSEEEGAYFWGHVLEQLKEKYAKHWERYKEGD